MVEVRKIHASVNPGETLFIVDSMTGQDAVNSAGAFNEQLDLTGVILTKTDGDARGGAALSIRHQTGRPIKFIGTGENNDALDPFHPDRIASRILGMGDVLSLVEEVERKVDREKVEKYFARIAKKYSICSTRVLGGDLDWVHQGMNAQEGIMTLELISAIVQSDKHVIPEAIKTRLGYHIILVCDNRDRIEKEKPKAPIKPKMAPTGTNIPT